MRALTYEAAPADTSGTHDGVDESTADYMDLIFRNHRQPLYHYLLRLTLDRYEAEDLLQETILRTWRYLRDHTLYEETLGPWLRTVARRIAIDATRARRSRPVETPTYDMSTIAGPNDAVDRMVVAQAVREGLLSLSPDHRNVLIEIFYHDRTAKEAAIHLKIPEGTVKSRTYYALRALAAAISAADHDNTAAQPAPR